MRRRWSRDDLLEEVRWFVDSGVSPFLIAQELGTSLYAVEKAARRAGDMGIVRLFDHARREEFRRKAA